MSLYADSQNYGTKTALNVWYTSIPQHILQYVHIKSDKQFILKGLYYK